MSTSMKAVTRYHYGNEDVINIKDLEIPVPKEHEILVKVHATTVNRTDCAILTGAPFIMRFFTGLRKPSSPFLGTDFAGTIESIGKKVTLFKPGQRVWGFQDMGLKSQAQFLLIKENAAIETIPEGTTFTQAAASAEGAHYAINMLNKVQLHPGQKAVVNGATGAIGSAVVQLSKYYGLEVTATCRREHTDLVKSMGASRVIDYTSEDFTKDKERYDFVFDAVGKSTFGKCKPILKQKGVYISSELGPRAQNLRLSIVAPILRGKKVVFPYPKDIMGSLQFMKGLLESGQFSPVIDRTYPLEKAAEAYQYVGSGQKVGNVMLSILNA